MIVKDGGGRVNVREQWNFNNVRIDIVNEYKYLGVLITKKNSMQKHLAEKLQTAKTTINFAWSNIFNNKYVAHSSKYRIFESVAESTVMYAAQAWGSKSYETVEKLLRFYVKRVFRLPNNCPNYLLMIETGISPLFIKTLKLQADYICRVLNMDDERLPKKAVLQTIRKRTSWFTDWTDLASEAGEELAPNEYHNWKPILYRIISTTDQRLRLKFIEEAKESIYRVYYSKLNHNLQQNNYFHDNNTTEQISMIFRLRGELLNLNFIPHRDDLKLQCELCNLQEREDVLHFIGRCPVLRETRRSIFGTDFLSEEMMCLYLNEISVQLLYKYCIIALSYRRRILTENF